MKMRNKGKVHPSPSPSPSPSNKDNTTTLSVLSLLPAAILTIASVLSLEDREVLAYMVTRSMKPTTPSLSFSRKNSKKLVSHKPPLFDCDCFDCYTNYWFRWDSSPNREFIHQAIEAFEEHLSKNEMLSKKMRNKKKVKLLLEKNVVEVEDEDFVHVLPENDPEVVEFLLENEVEVVEQSSPGKDVAAPSPGTAVMVRGTAPNGSGHKGLARKVLPDVLGLFNSRLWNLWSPNM